MSEKEKQTYERPELQKHGQLREVTLSSHDGGGGKGKGKG